MPTGEEHNGNSQSRLDRLEGLMELLITDHLRFSDEHRQLLTSQVLLVDSMDGLTKRVDKLASAFHELTEAQALTERKIQELTEAQKHTDERMNALITVVDGIVRRGPQPS
jgi:peptidoglycan hydrolase CwlO-like protein